MFVSFSVPIRIDVSPSDLIAGVIGIEGLLSYDEQQLTIDYQPFDRHLQKQEKNTASILLREIGEIYFEKGLFGGRIVVRPIRMSTLDGLPGGRSTELVVKVKRRDRSKAEVLISRVLLELSEARLEE